MIKMIKNMILTKFRWALWLGFLALPFMGKMAGILAIVILFILLLPLLNGIITRLGMLIRGLPFLSSFVNRLKTFLSSLTNRLKTNKRMTLIILFILVAILPLFMNRYFIDVAVLCGIYIVLALGLNIIVGLTGLLALGYIAFYAVGAYSYALLWTHYHINFWLSLPIGTALAGLFGVLLGSPVLRLRGDYLAIVTLGFGEITRIVLNNWDELTRGPNGILGIARPQINDFVIKQPIHYYYLILAFVILTIFIITRLEDSRIGRAWIAIREDEVAAAACGINVTLMKLLAFATGAGFAGLGGIFFAGKMMFVSPESFTFMESVMVLCMVVLGGMGSIPGVILGAMALIILPEVLREFQSYRLLVFGGAIALMMIIRPQGLIPSQRRKMELEEEWVKGGVG